MKCLNSYAKEKISITVWSILSLILGVVMGILVGGFGTVTTLEVLIGGKTYSSLLEASPIITSLGIIGQIGWILLILTPIYKFYRFIRDNLEDC